MHYVLGATLHPPGGGHAARSRPPALHAASLCASRASLRSDPSIQHRERCSNACKERRHATHATQPDRDARKGSGGRRSCLRRISERSEGTGTGLSGERTAFEVALAPAVGFVVDRGPAVPDLLGATSGGGAVVGFGLRTSVLPAAIALLGIGLVGVAAGFLLGDLDVSPLNGKRSGTCGPGEQLPPTRVPAAPCVDLNASAPIAVSAPCQLTPAHSQLSSLANCHATFLAP